MKATAVAHPIQGLVKYHGLRDPVRRLPFHNSVSVCTGPIHTRTTVEVLEDGESKATIDGEAVAGRAWERIQAVVNCVQEHTEDDRPFRMESKNDFPQYVGLGSSSSGFAALALAAARAYGWEADLERLSSIARLGAGSAARAITGGVSEWRVEGEHSDSHQILDPVGLDWEIVVPLVRHAEFTENVHREVLTSPLFEARVQAMGRTLAKLHEAVEEVDLPRIWGIAEQDTLNLHAVTMTGETGHVCWQPATVEVIHTVRRLRDDGVLAWFSIDTGATAYINTTKEDAKAVAKAVGKIRGIDDVLRLKPAGAAHTVDAHLF